MKKIIRLIAVVFVFFALSRTTAQVEAAQNVSIQSVTPKDSNSMIIKWNTVSGVDGYLIYRSTSQNGSYSYCALITNPGTNTYRDQNVSTGQSYYYKIFPYNNVNQKRVYGSASAIKGAKLIPNTPSINTIVGKDNGIVIKWNTTAGADGYMIYRSQSASGTYTYCGMMNNSTANMYMDRNVSKRQLYYYKVFAYNNTASGKVYGHSSAIQSGAICPKTVNNVNAYVLGNKKLFLNWDKVPDADGYMIYMSRSGDGKYQFEALLPGNSKNEYTDINLTVGGTFYYKVFAYYSNSSGRSYSESSVVASAQAIEKSPTGVYKVLGNGYKSQNLYWRVVNNASGYLVYRSKDNANFAYAGETKGAQSNSYVDSNLVCGTTYYYKVFPYYLIDGKRVCCKGSDVVSGKPIPARAKISSIEQIEGERLQITWGQVSGATGYLIYKSITPNGEFAYCGLVNNGAILNYVDSHVEKNNTYYYKVFAYRTVNGTKIYANASDVVGHDVVEEKNVHYGVDVSHYQQDIDWTQVRNAGMDFAIVKVAGRGIAGGGLYTDDYYVQNILGAQSAGLKVGAYFFSQALTVDEAREEAQFLLNYIRSYSITYPVVFDWETSSGYRTYDISVSQDQMNEIAYAFCDTISAAGYKAMVYGNQWDLMNRYNLGALQSRYDIWLARYWYSGGQRYQEGEETPDLGTKYMMWQFTSEGNVAGINGNVDMNISYYN